MRLQLAALARASVVCARDVPPVGRGRPLAHWQVTAAGARQLPDAHQGLATELLAVVQRHLGAAEFGRLLRQRTETQRAVYAAQRTATEREDRLAQLAQIRSREGYMAETGRDRDGALLLIEHHCPLFAAASRCPALCAEEILLFQSLMGEGVRVERRQHALCGASRCSYRVTMDGPL